MAEPRMSVTVSEDGARASLSFLPASGLEGSIELTLDQLSVLIGALGAARAQIAARQPPVSLKDAKIAAVVDPPWRVQPEALTEGSMLGFLHPAFGPVGFVLPPAEVEKLVRALTTHLGMVRRGKTKPS